MEDVIDDATAVLPVFVPPCDPFDAEDCDALKPHIVATKRDMLAKSTHVAVGGAGMHGLLFVGVLMALCEHDLDTYNKWVKNVKGVSGTSAGALIGFLLVCGLSPWYMRAAIHRCRLSRLVDSVSQTTIDEIKALGALTSGEIPDEAIRDMIITVTGKVDTTFAELHALTGRTFIVCVSNADTGRTAYWSHWTRPNMPVWFALRCTSSIPWIFNAPKEGDSAIFDGGLSCNVPCHMFPAAETLTLFVYVDYGPNGGNLCTGGLPGFPVVAYMLTVNPHLGAIRAQPKFAVRAVPCVALRDTVSKFAFDATLTEMDALIVSGCACLHGVLLRNLLIAIVVALAVVTARQNAIDAVTL